MRRNEAAAALFPPHCAGHPLVNSPVPDGLKAVADHCRPTTVIDAIDIAVSLVFGSSHSMTATIRSPFWKMARC